MVIRVAKIDVATVKTRESDRESSGAKHEVVEVVIPRRIANLNYAKETSVDLMFSLKCGLHSNQGHSSHVTDIPPDLRNHLGQPWPARLKRS